MDTRTMYGRRVITTDATEITAENVVEVLEEAMKLHEKNRSEIDYLWKYYKGEQPILQRSKTVRPEICNKIVENRANEIVSFKVGYLCGEPIQYVGRNCDEAITNNIGTLNEYMFLVDKPALDQEVVEWGMICGTASRMVLDNEAYVAESDEAPFEMYTLDPRDSFVVYSNDVKRKRVMGVKYNTDEFGTKTYSIYTDNRFYLVEGDALLLEEAGEEERDAERRNRKVIRASEKTHEFRDFLGDGDENDGRDKPNAERLERDKPDFPAGKRSAGSERRDDSHDNREEDDSENIVEDRRRENRHALGGIHLLLVRKYARRDSDARRGGHNSEEKALYVHESRAIRAEHRKNPQRADVAENERHDDPAKPDYSTGNGILEEKGQIRLKPGREKKDYGRNLPERIQLRAYGARD